MINQTVKADEIVLVKDGSLNKGLDEVIKKYDESYPKLLKIVTLPCSHGLGNALNHGLKAVRNEMVARMDTDDISLPDRCEMQLKAFEKKPELSIVGTQITEFEGQPCHIVPSRTVPSSYRNILRFSRRRSPFNHPTVMFRKSAVNEAGGYKAFGRKEDLELFIRMLYEGYKAINLKKAYLLYRTSPENLQRKKEWINCMEYIQIMNSFHKLGWNDAGDMLFVTAGQLFMYFAPDWLAGSLNKLLLRK